ISVALRPEQAALIDLLEPAVAEVPPPRTLRRWWPAGALALLLLLAAGAYSMWPRPAATPSVQGPVAEPALIGRLAALDARLQALEAGIVEARRLATDHGALEALANREAALEARLDRMIAAAPSAAPD